MQSRPGTRWRDWTSVLLTMRPGVRLVLQVSHLLSVTGYWGRSCWLPNITKYPHSCRLMFERSICSVSSLPWFLRSIRSMDCSNLRNYAVALFNTRVGRRHRTEDYRRSRTLGKFRKAGGVVPWLQNSSASDCSQKLLQLDSTLSLFTPGKSLRSNWLDPSPLDDST